MLEKTVDYVFFCSGTVEVLAYPSLRPLDTLMAHTAGCYCIAIDPIGRCASKLCLFVMGFSLVKTAAYLLALAL